MIYFSAGFLAGAICFFLGYKAASYRLRDDAVDRGVARYHPQTGKWEWTVEEVK